MFWYHQIVYSQLYMCMSIFVIFFTSENSHNLPILSELQTRKLQLLTIASLASKSKVSFSCFIYCFTPVVTPIIGKFFDVTVR